MPDSKDATCGLWKKPTLSTRRLGPRNNSEVCPGLSTAGEKQRGEQKKFLPFAPDFGLNRRDSHVGRSCRLGAVPRFDAGGTCLSDDQEPEAARPGGGSDRQGTGHRSLYDRGSAAGRVPGFALSRDRGALRQRPRADHRHFPDLSRRTFETAGRGAARAERGLFRADRSAQFCDGP
ncbi:hypothetical protein D3C87_1252870 [compost metagenome]